MHPALPKEFDGVDAIGRAFTAFTEGKITRTGVMIHRVTPVVDRGEVLLTQEVIYSVYWLFGAQFVSKATRTHHEAFLVKLRMRSGTFRHHE